MKLVLIPCTATEWREEGRLLGRVELPLAEEAEPLCEAWAGQLRELEMKLIYHGPDELASRTAKLLGRKLLVPTKAVASLAEVDVGLWAGLTDQQLKARFASAHRELRESLLNVNPPGGENLGQARERLESFLRKQAKRHPRATLGLVLRPVAFSMVWCSTTGRPASAVWEAAKRVAEPAVVDYPVPAAGVPA